jgi:hypothetical protein
LGILCPSVGLVKLDDKPFQIRVVHTGVECIDRRFRQEVILGAIAIEIDPSDVGAERRWGEGPGRIFEINAR